MGDYSKHLSPHTSNYSWISKLFIVQLFMHCMGDYSWNFKALYVTQNHLKFQYISIYFGWETFIIQIIILDTIWLFLNCKAFYSTTMGKDYYWNFKTLYVTQIHLKFHYISIYFGWETFIIQIVILDTRWVTTILELQSILLYNYGKRLFLKFQSIIWVNFQSILVLVDEYQSTLQFYDVRKTCTNLFNMFLLKFQIH